MEDGEWRMKTERGDGREDGLELRAGKCGGKTVEMEGWRDEGMEGKKVSQWRLERMHFPIEYGAIRVRYFEPKYWPCTLCSCAVP